MALQIVSSYVLVSDDFLRDAINNVNTMAGSACKFFDSFDYKKDLLEHRYSDALTKGVSLLDRCQRVAPDAYKKIHKGTPFYFIGMAAFYLSDYETAVFFSTPLFLKI